MVSSLPEPISQTRPVEIAKPIDTSLYESAAHLAMPDALASLAFSATGPSLHTITIDTGPGMGGTNLGPEPMELLLLALGSCTGMDVISILRKKRQEVTGYAINVYANQSKEHPQVYTGIMVEHIIEGRSVQPQAVGRSIELSITRYCPVHTMLAKSTRVEHVYRILDSKSGGT